ncbi:hypothetical protein CYMTET_18151 [Cymbomonas tetramitiformis]|uniref:peptidylprolyl isomerase n=1 Tax=Cymbomonas tetramitiformis TaxID=36881 RepID=A0AAE0L6K7_9CHLO|nr:hypothetical protein CYMTET_18151 [Cymbomonas tetramitiformis]
MITRRIVLLRLQHNFVLLLCSLSFVIADDTEQGAAFNVTVLPDGLKYIDRVVGTGDAVGPDDTVSVHYNAQVKDGILFDSTSQRGQAFTFQIGSNRVCPGLSEAVSSMKVGGKRLAIVPPDLGFGQRKVGKVPKNSTLIFDIELIENMGNIWNRTVDSDGTPPDNNNFNFGQDLYDYSHTDSDSDFVWAHSVPSPPEVTHLEICQALLANVTARLNQVYTTPPPPPAQAPLSIPKVVFEVIAGLAMATCTLVGAFVIWNHTRNRLTVFMRLRDYDGNGGFDDGL